MGMLGQIRMGLGKRVSEKGERLRMRMLWVR